jgi:hypothetical protein
MEESMSPDEIIKLCNENAGPHGKSPMYVNN